MIICPIHGKQKNVPLSFGKNSRLKKYNGIDACCCHKCKTYYVDLPGIKNGELKNLRPENEKNYKIKNIHKNYPVPTEVYVISKERMSQLNQVVKLIEIDCFETSNSEVYRIPTKYDEKDKKFYITIGAYNSCLELLNNLHIRTVVEKAEIKKTKSILLQEYVGENIVKMKHEKIKKGGIDSFNFKDLKQNRRTAIAYESANIQYNPYQYLPWLYMFNEGNNNIFISDEVGLGKTIEAGILIKEELHEYPEHNILIICPAFLRNKWKEELKEKFYIDAAIFDIQGLQSNVIILPLSRIQRFNEKNKRHFDMIVVDEAHYFKNIQSVRYGYLNEFLNHNKPKKRVLMTATPINNKDADFAALKKLLGSNFVKTSTTKRQAYIHLPKRNIKEIYVDLNNEEQSLYDVTDQLDPFSGTIYRHIGASCLYALSKYARKYSNNESDVKQELRECMEELLGEEYENDDVIEKIREDIFKVNLKGNDSKLDALFNLIEDIEDKKIVIFSHYIETVKYLKNEIGKYFRCEFIYANNFSNHTVIANKKNRFLDAKEWFDSQDMNEKTILVCSDSCKEGIDLDKASCLINYDLPFNPSILEQRIGRIDRMCQKHDMNIYNFHVNNTYDDRLHMILSAKLLIIDYFAEYGIGNPLAIMENNTSPFDRFVAYFKKESNFSMTSDDFKVIKRILEKIEVKILQSISQKDILDLLIKYKQRIIELFNEQEIEGLTEEQLEIQKSILNKKLGFVIYSPSGKVKLSISLKKKLAKMMNEDVSLKIELKSIIIGYEQKLKYVEDTGYPMVIDEEDIKSSFSFNKASANKENFISKRMIDFLKEQGAEIYENS